MSKVVKIVDHRTQDLARRLPGVSQLDRVRAARAMLESQNGDEAAYLNAFLNIFHPETSDVRRRELIADVRSKRRY